MFNNISFARALKCIKKQAMCSLRTESSSNLFHSTAVKVILKNIKVHRKSYKINVTPYNNLRETTFTTISK